jgi:quercetin dioxygenase-like cupin family protein
MDTAKPVVADLESMIEVAEQGIVSKAIVENEHHKIIQFTLAAGQELSEHTASVPAVIHVLQGQGTVSLGGDAHEARPGMLYYMPAEMKHAVVAQGDLVFLLTMFRT